MLTITWSFPWVGILYIAELWHSWSHQSACKSLVRYRQVCDRQQNGWQAYSMEYNKWEASWHSKKAHLCQDCTRHCTHGISFTHSNNPQSRNHYPRLTAQRNGHSENLKYTAPTNVTGNRVGVSVQTQTCLIPEPLEWAIGSPTHTNPLITLPLSFYPFLIRHTVGAQENISC